MSWPHARALRMLVAMLLKPMCQYNNTNTNTNTQYKGTRPIVAGVPVPSLQLAQLRNHLVQCLEHRWRK